jgi:tellurite resistance protein
MSSKASSFLANLPAFDQMVKAQKEVIAEAQAADVAAAADAAQAVAETLWQTKLQACVDAAYLIASADGATGSHEVSHIADKMSDITGGELSTTDVRAMLDISAEKVSGGSRDGLVDEIAGLVEDDAERETAFTVAAAVSWTGGGIGVKEGLALQALSKAFGWEMNHMHKLLGKARG